MGMLSVVRVSRPLVAAIGAFAFAFAFAPTLAGGCATAGTAGSGSGESSESSEVTSGTGIGLATSGTGTSITIPTGIATTTAFPSTGAFTVPSSTASSSATATASTGVTGGESSSDPFTSATSTSGHATSRSSSGGSSSCGKPPELYAETHAGVYCPYSVGDGGNAYSCAASEHCCEPASGTSKCYTHGDMCPAADVDWQCLEAIDCASSSAGHVCCGTGTIAVQAACGSEPAYDYVSNFKGTVCATSCTSSEYVVCEKDSDCTGSETCVAAKAKGGDFGHCSTTGM